MCRWHRVVKAWARCRARNWRSKMLREAGFEQVAIRHLPHDLQNRFYVVRKAPRRYLTDAPRFGGASVGHKVTLP